MTSISKTSAAAVLTLLCFLGAAASASAQPDPPKAITQLIHDVWQTRDGLPQNTVTAIAQTPDGYLWLGTREGLARFDGVRFTVFTTETTPQIAHPQIVTLFVDRSGRLWIGTWGGGLATLEAGRFSRLSTANGLPSDVVSAIAEDAQGRLWVGTDGGGLARLDGNRFTTIEAHGTFGTHVRALVAGQDGVWIGSDAGLAHLQADGSLESFGTDRGLAHQSIRALARDRDGVLWIGTEHGLNRLDRDTISGFADGTPLAHDLVFALMQDKAGDLWIGTDARGLRRLHEGTVSTFSIAEGLSHNSVCALFEDREGNLWAGTNLGGLNRLRAGPITPLTAREGLSSNFTRAVFEDAQGSVWIGTEGGGVDRLKDGIVTTFTTRDGLSNDTVFAIAQDPAGMIWLGTDSGLTAFDGKRMRSVTINSSIANESILALAIDRDGSIWLGTYAAGLIHYSNGTFTAFDTKHGFAHDTVNVIHPARDGTLWIGTRGGGLVRYRAGAFTTFATKDGLSDNLVFALHEDGDGALWIGTYGGGLNRLKDGRITAITRANGLYDSVIHRVIPDDDGRFWMSTNRGIFSVRKDELDAVADRAAAAVTSEAYGTSHGMVNAECNGGGSAGTRTRDGRIWFPTIAGVISFNPSELGDSRPAPPVKIEDVIVDGRAIDRDTAIRLPADAQTLEIDFTAMTLVRPAATRFRYRLEGLEDGWVEAGSRRAAYYSKLPPGAYSFKVIADADGVWSDAPTAIAVSVAPVWFETVWFRAAVGIGLMLFGLVLFRLRVRGLTAQKSSLERLVAERTTALAEANARLLQLSQEDGLTGLLNRRAFDAALDEECRRAIRGKAPLALLMLDIDAFKAYNDRLGHQAGDACLRAVADAVRHAHRRAGELVARYGGEEFAVIIPGATDVAAAEMAEHVRRTVAALALPHPHSSVGPVVTISVGVGSCAAGVPCNHQQLIASADRALYRAKQEGRNRVASERG